MKLNKEQQQRFARERERYREIKKEIAPYAVKKTVTVGSTRGKWRDTALVVPDAHRHDVVYWTGD